MTNLASAQKQAQKCKNIKNIKIKIIEQTCTTKTIAQLWKICTDGAWDFVHLFTTLFVDSVATYTLVFIDSVHIDWALYV